MPGRKTHGSVFQLIDNFTLFHFRFLADLDEDDDGVWMDMQNSSAINVWRGLSFERVCLVHAEQIKRALGISGVRTKLYAWRSQNVGGKNGAGAHGAQIDLLIERADNAVNICEMKYSASEYEIDREESRRMLNRRDRFISEERCKGAVYLTFVTTCGLAHNMYWNDVQSEVTLDDLFK